MSDDQNDIIERLKKVIDPELNKDIVSLGFIKNVKVDAKQVSIDLNLTSPACPFLETIVSDINKTLEGYFVNINLGYIVPSGALTRKQGIQKVKNIIGIGSGKGGVGKSTIAILTALALKETGARVGILDADFYGATIPSMLGAIEQPNVNENQMVEPVEYYGMKIISMSYFLPPGASLIWRGPLLAKAIDDFVTKVEWGELDYLVIDMPPGTGDVPLTFSQERLINAAVIVSTPQPAALNVALKMVDVFNKLNVPIVGIIENMSYLICPGSNERVDLFGQGVVEKKAKEIGIDYLGSMPLLPKLREAEDVGLNLDQMADVIKMYVPIAKKMAGRISIIDFNAKDKPFFLNLQKKPKQ
ncbi:MAG: P-loop NTPase [Nitrososphaerota archaeon]|jgi:ATP-binding protein involved in chromosome partitioning|nr:Mrp/NBP35 family ATP-binding protein [Nitrososphaerota archaeon]MDG6936490.1 P-loop NTPase [Nitrososphaerota archaeon]MDG6944644.1 P-loop NTPase [Nitrososphaerota archaeon]